MRGIVADITNQTGSTDKTTNQNQAGGSSPWDEPIDLPEQPEEKSQGPQIIGSLDSGTEQSIKQEKPVPFNIPEEVVEEKVGKKVPAEEVMGRDKPIFGDSLNSIEKNTANKVESTSTAPNNGTNIINQKVKKDTRDIPRATNTGNLQIHKIEKAGDVAIQTSDDAKPITKPEIVAKTMEDSSYNQAENLPNSSSNNLKQFNAAVSLAPSEPNNKSEKIDLVEQKTNTESGISELILGGNTKEDEGLIEDKENEQKPTVVKTDVPTAAKPEPNPLADKKDDQQSEKGISELLLGDEADPFADPFSDGDNINNAPLPDNGSNNVSTIGNGVATGAEAKDSAKTNMPLQQTARREFDITPPPDKAPVQSPPNTEKNIPAKSAVTPQATSQPIVQNTPVAQKKSSFFSRINPFSKKKKSSDMPGANIGDKPIPAVAAANAANPTPAPQNLMPAAPRKAAFKLSPKFSIVFSLLFLLIGSIYLTEIGLVSFGIENIYGIVGLEKIWGGLPKSSESALAIAVSRGQDHLNFKFKGSISATIDKTKKSSVTSPFISYGRPVQPLADIMNSASQNASLAQYDYYGDSTTEDTSSDTISDYYSGDASGDSTDSSTSTSSSSTSSTSSTSSSGSTATDSDINSPTPSETDTASGTESTNSTAITETTTKQIELEISGDSNDKNLSSELVVKPLVGSDKYIDLMSNTGSLYVKSDDLKFDDKAQSGKWLAYKFSGFETENTFASFLNLNTNSGFSIIGSRQANEKLSDGSRAYKYKIENMEIGDTFTNLGISKEMVQSINGNIWIGVRDHLIHKVSLEIAPSVSAGFTKISCDLEFYDYDISNEITLPAFDNIITIENADTDQNTDLGDTSSTTSTSTSNNVPASSSSSSTNTSVGNQRTAADSQRQSDLLSIKSALQSYKDRYGYYPKSSSFENVGLSNGILSRTLIPRYTSSLPADPKAAEGWWYGYKSDGKSFTLSARFENINDSEVTKVGSIYLHYVYGN